VKFFCPGAESGLLLGRLSAQMQLPDSGGDSDSSAESEDTLELPWDVGIQGQKSYGKCRERLILR
jgi:hypothetical protein